jgi:hypothetical protein
MITSPADMNDNHDPEVVAWIEAQPRHLTFGELAVACADLFGKRRAWDADQIRRYWDAAHTTLERSPIDNDPVLLAFLRDRVGRFAVDQILIDYRRRHPDRYVPSRSAAYRWLSRERRSRSARDFGASHA